MLKLNWIVLSGAGAFPLKSFFSYFDTYGLYPNFRPTFLKYPACDCSANLLVDVRILKLRWRPENLGSFYERSYHSIGPRLLSHKKVEFYGVTQFHARFHRETSNWICLLSFYPFFFQTNSWSINILKNNPRPSGVIISPISYIKIFSFLFATILFEYISSWFCRISNWEDWI